MKRWLAGAMSLEDRNDLKQFLKVIRPDWSCPKKRGGNDCTRVMQKLQAIGINDTAQLLERVAKNTINEELSSAGCSRFSRDTLQAIRKQGTFFQSLDHLKEPSYRQIGLFAPVPQMLTGRNLRNQVLKSANQNSGALQPVTGQRSNESERSSRGGAQLRPSTVSGITGSTPESVSATSSSPRMRPYTVTGMSGAATPHTVSSVGASSSFTALPRLRGVTPSRRGSRHGKRQLATSASAPVLLGSDCADSEAAPSSSGYHSRRRDSGNSSIWGGSSSVTTAPRERPPAAVAFKELDEDQLFDRDVDRWNKAGLRMTSQQRDPQWSSFSSQLLEHGEAMIREQDALDDKRKLYQQIRNEGPCSPMRAHVARKIRSRLREEHLHDAQVALDVQQTCMSIRKNIEAMMKTRRVLASVNTEAKNVVEPQKEGKRLVGLSLDLFKKQKNLESFCEGPDEDSPAEDYTP